ncbi:hypothetical protein [Streptomyces sp. NPDC048445]|uniref:hypothetical protein n=1 Tax=Streptomyces sp. NPDC048445 TaxID=3365553 RepID=UPI0037162AB6
MTAAWLPMPPGRDWRTQAATVIYTAVHYTFGHVIEEQDSAEAQPTEEFELACRPWFAS